MAEQFRADWYYGNAVYYGHLVLGEVALARGDKSGAATELLAAGRTRGSPQLNSFGPNMRLAKALLQAGERAAVLGYLQSCASFWALGHRRLQDWAELVSTGGVPDFGPNLGYWRVLPNLRLKLPARDGRLVVKGIYLVCGRRRPQLRRIPLGSPPEVGAYGSH